MENGSLLPNCLPFGPGTVGSSEWQCTEICAKDRGQPLPPVVLLLSHSSEGVVLSHLPAVFLVICLLYHSLILFSPRCPLISGSVLSAALHPSLLPSVHPVFLAAQVLTARVFTFLKTTHKQMKGLAQSLSMVRNSAKLKGTNLGINPVNTVKKGDLNLSLPQ